MSTPRPRTRWSVRAVVALAATGLILGAGNAGATTPPDTTAPADTSNTSDTAAASAADAGDTPPWVEVAELVELGPPGEPAGEYPLELTTAFGTTTLDDAPQTVATVTTVDTDIALALGFEPLIVPKYGDNELGEFTTDVFEARGWEVNVFDAVDGVDFEAIAEVQPDAIIAVSDWSAGDNFGPLSDIAPVVGLPTEDDYLVMSWQDRLRIAGEALGVPDRAEAVIEAVDAMYAEAAAAHPEWDGATLTYSVAHPTQISYLWTSDVDMAVFEGLGFVSAETAADYTAIESAVSLENIIDIDADVVLVGYPFGPDGVLSQDDLESDPLFQSIPAVAEDRYAVVPDDIASEIAYPTPLSDPWIIDQVVPLLESVGR
ncbi:MAG: ABC transporter substrate-binding protein [Desertimonas sp.]